MVTGIGIAVVIGVTAYAATRWALGGKERELARQREHMIQEIIKRHQGAIEDLAEDQGAIALKLAEYVSRTDQNEARLARLKEELQIFTAALAELKQEKDDLQVQSA
jgi:chromosome segregation ATPase